MTNRSDEGRARAEALFKKQPRQSKANDQVLAEHAAAGRAADANRAKLKSQRLVKEAAERTAKGDQAAKSRKTKP